MPAFTQPDGFIFEEPGDQPGISLTGGEFGTEEILAEQIQEKFQTLDAAAASLASRVTAIENGTGGIGWIPIATGGGAGSDFTVDLTDGGRFPDPPLWNLVQLNMRFGLDDAGSVNLQINGESVGLYRSGYWMMDSDGPNPEIPFWAEQNSWRIARSGVFSTNNLVFTLFHTAADPGLLNFQCSFNQEGASGNTHRQGMASGALTAEGRTVSSLRLFTAGGASQFDNTAWWALGLRMEHPS